MHVAWQLEALLAKSRVCLSVSTHLQLTFVRLVRSHHDARKQLRPACVSAILSDVTTFACVATLFTAASEDTHRPSTAIQAVPFATCCPAD